MATSTRRIIKVAGITLSAISILLLLNTIFRHSSNNPPPTKLRSVRALYSRFIHRLHKFRQQGFRANACHIAPNGKTKPKPKPHTNRVEEPVVVILVHPSPTLNRAANFELKRAIARTWAKDVEDFGANVFFVGEHDGETVMRRPSEFQGRAQSLSMRFMDPTDGAEEGGIGGGGNGGRGGGTTGGSGDGGVDSAEEDYSRQEPMRKMLIPSILENGQADGASGLLKVISMSASFLSHF
jgi:hypothetical protein